MTADERRNTQDKCVCPKCHAPPNLPKWRCAVCGGTPRLDEQAKPAAAAAPKVTVTTTSGFASAEEAARAKAMYNDAEMARKHREANAARMAAIDAEEKKKKDEAEAAAARKKKAEAEAAAARKIQAAKRAQANNAKPGGGAAGSTKPAPSAAGKAKPGEVPMVHCPKRNMMVPKDPLPAMMCDDCGDSMEDWDDGYEEKKNLCWLKHSAQATAWCRSVLSDVGVDTKHPGLFVCVDCSRSLKQHRCVLCNKTFDATKGGYRLKPCCKDYRHYEKKRDTCTRCTGNKRLK